MKLHPALFAASAALLLAACSDSPSDDVAAAPDNEVPASASASPRAYAEYAGSLAKSETALPLEVNKVTPPTSETEAPLTF